MPATRSMSHPTPPRPLRSNRSHANLDPDVIIISSDDDEAPAIPRKRHAPKKSARQQAKSRAKTSTGAMQVLEIESGDESDPSSATMANLQMQLKKLQAENARLKKKQPEGGSPAAVVEDLQTQVSHSDESKKKLLFALDDQLSCEICTMRMWTPYTLICGHTFCQTCLQDWFSTALAQHMTNHPHYNPNPPIPPQYIQALQNPNITALNHRQIRRAIDVILEQQPQPNYTCPTCRVAVKTKPVEVYALKNVVRTVAEAMGETSPKKTVAARGHHNNGPWDGFFPKLLML